MRNLHCEEGWIQELQVPNLPDTADVTLLCSDNKKFYAHSVVLSLSPVLRRCLGLVDVRVSRDATINVQFHHTVVAALLSFLYTGHAKLDSDLREEFFKLCHSLRLNPPITEEKIYNNDKTNNANSDPISSQHSRSDHTPSDKAIETFTNTKDVKDTNPKQHSPHTPTLPPDKVPAKALPNTSPQPRTDPSNTKNKSTNLGIIPEESQKQDPRNPDAHGLHQNVDTDGKNIKVSTPSMVSGGIQTLLSFKDDNPIDINPNQTSPRINKPDQNLSSHSASISRSESSFTSSTTSNTDPILPSLIQVVREDPFKNIRLAGFLAASSASKTKETSLAGASSGQNTSFSKTSTSSDGKTRTEWGKKLSATSHQTDSLLPAPKPIQEPVIPLTCDTCYKIYVGKEALARHKTSDHRTEEDTEIGRYVTELIAKQAAKTKEASLETNSDIRPEDEGGGEEDISNDEGNNVTDSIESGEENEETGNNVGDLEPVTVATTSKFEDISSDENEVEQQEQKQKLELRLVDEDKLKEKIIEKDETSVTDKQKSMDIPAENVSNVMDKEFDTAKDSGADVNEGKTSIDEPDASVNVDAPVAASLAEPFIEDEDEETPERISDYLSELNKQAKTKAKKGDSKGKKSPTKSSLDKKQVKNKPDKKSKDASKAHDELQLKQREVEIKSIEDKLSAMIFPSSTISPPAMETVKIPDANPIKGLESDNYENDFDDSGFKEFKMPENFDIPHDYIQEIVPKMNTSRDSDTADALSERPMSPLTVDIPAVSDLVSVSDPNIGVKNPSSVITPDSRDSSPTSAVPAVSGVVAASYGLGNQFHKTPGGGSMLSPEHITYYSKDNSSRKEVKLYMLLVSKGTRRHAVDDIRWNRRKKSYISELFDEENSQEDSGGDLLVTVPTEPGAIPATRKEFETCGGTATILNTAALTGDILASIGKDTSRVGLPEQVTPDSGLIDELKDKKERIKRKLMVEDSDPEEIPSYLKEKRKKKKKKSSNDVTPSRSTTSPVSGSSSTVAASVVTSKQTPPTTSTKPTRNGSSKLDTPSKKFGGTTTTLKYSKSGESSRGSKAPYKFENDFQWLVNDSFEDSSDNERRQRKKEKKRKKRKRQKSRGDEEEEAESSEDPEDDRRKRLDARKKRKGGDVLAWMNRRPKVSVKYWDEGRETIIEKYIYKMNMLGADDSSGSSGVDQELRNRIRHSSSSDDSLPSFHHHSSSNRGASRSPPLHRKKQKQKKEKRDKTRKKHHSSSSDFSRPGSAAGRSKSPQHHSPGASSESRHSFSAFMRQLSNEALQSPSAGKHDEDRKKAALLRRSVSLLDERKLQPKHPPPLVPAHHAASQSFQRSLSSSFTSFKIPKKSSSKNSTGD